MLLLLAGIVFVPMLVEARLARRNERAQLGRGGVEPPGDVYRTMRVAYPAAFLSMLAERAVRGEPPGALVVGGLVLFGLAKGLKWWAIVTLGPRWTFRVIVVPGMPLVSRGPYRRLRHPNYVAVAGELVSVALVAGAVITGPAAVAGFGWLLRRRMAVEERALGRAAKG